MKVYYGLCIVGEKEITRLEVEVNSSMVVGFLKKEIYNTFYVKLAFYQKTKKSKLFMYIEKLIM